MKNDKNIFFLGDTKWQPQHNYPDNGFKEKVLTIHQ